jgi:hypothetical protein
MSKHKDILDFKTKQEFYKHFDYMSVTPKSLNIAGIPHSTHQSLDGRVDCGVVVMFLEEDVNCRIAEVRSKLAKTKLPKPNKVEDIPHGLRKVSPTPEDIEFSLLESRIYNDKVFDMKQSVSYAIEHELDIAMYLVSLGYIK